MMFLLACFFFPFVFAFPQHSSEPLPLVMDFEDWKKLFQPEGFHSEQEDLLRRQIYEENVAYILKENAKKSGLVLGVNQYSALTFEEMQKRVLTPSRFDKPSMMQSSKQNVKFFNDSEVKVLLKNAPGSLDWRDRGAIGRVRAQGMCGNCFVFSAVGAIEACVQIISGTLTELSDAEATQCLIKGACSGGQIPSVFDAVNKNGGLNSFSEYPWHYGDHSHPCLDKKVPHKVATTHSWIILNPDIYTRADDAHLIAALQRGPVASSIGTDHKFHNYRGGIYNDTSKDGCKKYYNHAVLVVGYTPDYYIIKNSWSMGWGERGYMRIARTPGDKSMGVCNILGWSQYQPVQCEMLPPTTMPTLSPIIMPTYAPIVDPEHPPYGNPKYGCRQGDWPEKPFIWTTVGSFCSAKAIKKPCSADVVKKRGGPRSCWIYLCPRVPYGVVGHKMSELGDTDGKPTCGIRCDPKASNQCDEKNNFVCRGYIDSSKIQRGLCVYPFENDIILRKKLVNGTGPAILSLQTN